MMNKLLKSKKFFVAIICIIVILMIAIIGFLLKSSNENITGNVALGIYDSAIKTADVLNTVSGNAIYDTYLGFSNPESRFAINIRNITFENDSDIAYVTFTVKDYIIYEKGYVSLDGQDWAEFTLNPVGELKDGWIKYGATATIAMNKNALRLSDARTETSENYAIVYTCSIVNKSWDCHNGWQIVDFRAQFKKKPTAIINNTNTTNNGSGTTGGSTGGAGTNTTGNATQNTTNTTAPSNTTSNTTISSDVLAYCKQVCDHIIYPNQSYVRGYQIGNILPGDTICIPAGTRRELSLLNTRGSPSNPITITNCGGQAIIDASLDTGHGILLQNVSYFRLTGTGDSNFKYGIKVINADSSGIAATSLSTDMEIDHLEIANVGFAGLLLKTDPGCSMTAAREYFVQYNTLAHDNYIHDVAGEGIYLGSSFYLGGHVHRCNNVSISIAPGDVTNIGIPTSPNYDAFVMGPGWSCQQVGSGSGTIANNTLVTFKVPGSSKEYQGAYKGGPVSMTGSSMLCNNASLLILPHEIKGVRVYNNIIRNSGWDCLQVGSSTSDVEIYNNSLIGCGLEGVYGQTIAMQINPGTTGKIYNNYIEGGAHGIQLQGAGDNIIFNNIIVDSEGDGIITTGSADAIRPGKGYHIENNLILNPIRYGVYIITSATTGTTIRNNIVIGGQQTVRAGSTTIANSIISNNLNNSNISFYKFVNPAAKNYHYSSDSPMVNAGTPTSDWFVTKDLDSVSRPQGVAYDVGPYEYVAAAIVDQDSDGYAADDCDNSNPAINPGAVEICGNGIDENCDLADAVCPIVAIDSDSDGVNSTADCNDSNAAVWVLRTGYPDFDYDSYTLASQQICSGNSLPSGYRNTTAGTDCADNNANINPSKIEICGNNIDENCNGSDLACPAPSSNGDLCDTSVTVSACFSHFGRLQTLVDGNYSTYDDSWNGCASSPEWWQFTFQNAKTINKISFLEKNFVDGWIASSPLYYVEYLDSNNQWRQAANIKRSPTNVAGSYVGVSWNNVSFDNITTTSFRLMLYSGGSSTFTGLGEVECFAEATTPLPTCSDGIKNGAETDVDCGGTCAACTIDSDSDGFNSANDCNDNNAAVWILRTGYSDSDNDGYTIGTLQQICSGNSLPAGYKPTSLGTDCADGDANVNPGKTEVCGNGLDDDCSAGDAVCAAPASCSDGIKNNDEIGVDCDGSCPACIIGGGNLSVKFSSGNILGHWVYLPANYNPSRATPYPVVYMLRGSGEDGLGNNQSSMDKLKVNGMLKLISSNSWPPNKAKLTRQEQVEISDMIVIVPQDWSAGTFSYSRLDTLMVHISQTYNIDENRVYGTGLSAGGIGLGTYLVQYAGSSRFAAMVPISPNLNNAQPYACINRDVRIWVFHGANDTNGPTSPYNGPNYKAVAQNCNPLPIVKSTIYPGCGHSACAWDDTYDLDKLNVASLTSWNGVALDPYDKNIYSWMLQYSKDCTTKTCGKLYDADADTYNNTADCNDNNANINPGKAEVCDNGLDDDCSGGDAVCQAVNNTLNSSKKINYLTSPNYNYGIYVPSGYYLSNNSNRNWPVVFFLHGSGERGTGMSTITKVATNGPLKLVNSGENFDMIIIAPQTDSWSWATAPTTFNITDDFVEEMFAKYRIDKKKVYLTGLSMGGEGSWDYAFNAPDKVAAIVSIAGDTNYRSQVCTLKNKVAAWAFHNRNDTAIGSYGQRVALIQALDNNCGSPSPDSNAKYTEYPLNSHNAWTQTYDGTGMGTENSSYDAFDQDIYSWMLSYSKDCSSGTCVFKKVVVDADSDGYNSAVDCNDNNANVNPGRTEVCGNGLDDDCSSGDATCAPTPTCSDGIMNGGELGIDCGGTCPNACTSLLTTGKKGTQYLFNVTGSGITGYILYLPPNYSPANDYPVMIFLHGAGEKFSGGYLNYTLLRKTAIPQMINNGYDLPFIVIMPQVGTTGDWNYAALSKVVTVLDSVAANYSVDSTRIYVTGLSMGGGGTNKFVEEYYQLPAAAVPIAGWGSVTCANTEKIPRWSFHNNIDTTVASSGSRNVYNNHKKCAGAVDPRLSIYNASGHDSWSKTYNLNGMYDIMQNGTGSINYTEEIYMWFMRYSRPELSGTTCFTCIVDYDNDGSKMNLDCNDGNASINPNAEEICGNTIDENCDGIKAGACPVAPVDSDSDGYNSTADCNDNNANVNPGETEVCGNGLDDDCSGGDATCAATPTCSDGIMNGDESGVDCGGSCAATCISSNPPSGINGLLVSYPFTANANDASGNSRNGIVSGATWSSLSSSGVYSFDGNDYITVTNGGELDGLSAFSLEAWVYNPNFTGSNEYIVGKRKDVNSSWGLYVETASAGFVFFINDTAKNIRTPATLGEWQYITTTWDGSTMKIYSNGVMTSSMSFDSNMNVYPTANVLVGARESATARTLHYNGKIGEVHIYNKALSSSEVQSRYDSTRGKYS